MLTDIQVEALDVFALVVGAVLLCFNQRQVTVSVVTHCKVGV